MKNLIRAAVVAALLAASGFSCLAAPPQPSTTIMADYNSLVTLFQQWRAFARPARDNGVPDYSESAMARKAAELPSWRARLKQIDPAGWPLAQRNDHRLVEAEMDGFDFDLRILRPWARDPHFYVSVWSDRSDVPSREGPVSEPEIELYDYSFPLSAADQTRLTRALSIVPALLAQARGNLSKSNARDLWIFGIRSLREQSERLAALEDGRLTVSTLEGAWRANLDGAGPPLRKAVADARTATDNFVAWLEAEAPRKTGPSGVGKENYTWYQQRVHLMPYGWEEQVTLLTRELERAHASLRLEESRNRGLRPLEPLADAGAFNKMAEERVDTFLAFLVRSRMVHDKAYLKPALLPRTIRYVPADKRTFFDHATMREPMTLYAHDYHWFDLARMKLEPHPSPIRRAVLLSNIWDTKAEGFATAFEELVMHNGLYDDNPRAREIVWIMLANRAARGLASLHVQANEWTLEQAGEFHARWTPRDWSASKDKLTAFEQLLYLRQPGYGTSYVTGKLLLDRIIAVHGVAAERAGRAFQFDDFLAGFDSVGMVPMSIVSEELLPP